MRKALFWLAVDGAASMLPPDHFFRAVLRSRAAARAAPPRRRTAAPSRRRGPTRRPSLALVLRYAAPATALPPRAPEPPWRARFFSAAAASAIARASLAPVGDDV